MESVASATLCSDSRYEEKDTCYCDRRSRMSSHRTPTKGDAMTGGEIRTVSADRTLTGGDSSTVETVFFVAPTARIVGPQLPVSTSTKKEVDTSKVVKPEKDVDTPKVVKQEKDVDTSKVVKQKTVLSSHKPLERPRAEHSPAVPIQQGEVVTALGHVQQSEMVTALGVTDEFTQTSYSSSPSRRSRSTPPCWAPIVSSLPSKVVTHGWKKGVHKHVDYVPSSSSVASSSQEQEEDVPQTSADAVESADSVESEVIVIVDQKTSGELFTKTCADGTLGLGLDNNMRVVAMDGWAAGAGFGLGDRLVAINDTPVEGLGPDGIVALIRDAGRPISVTVAIQHAASLSQDAPAAASLVLSKDLLIGKLVTHGWKKGLHKHVDYVPSSSSVSVSSQEQEDDPAQQAASAESAADSVEAVIVIPTRTLSKDSIAGKVMTHGWKKGVHKHVNYVPSSSGSVTSSEEQRQEQEDVPEKSADAESVESVVVSPTRPPAPVTSKDSSLTGKVVTHGWKKGIHKHSEEIVVVPEQVELIAARVQHVLQNWDSDYGDGGDLPAGEQELEGFVPPPMQMPTAVLLTTTFDGGDTDPLGAKNRPPIDSVWTAAPAPLYSSYQDDHVGQQYGGGYASFSTIQLDMERLLIHISRMDAQGVVLPPVSSEEETAGEQEMVDGGRVGASGDVEGPDLIDRVVELVGRVEELAEEVVEGGVEGVESDVEVVAEKTGVTGMIGGAVEWIENAYDFYTVGGVCVVLGSGGLVFGRLCGSGRVFFWEAMRRNRDWWCGHVDVCRYRLAIIVFAGHNAVVEFLLAFQFFPARVPTTRKRRRPRQNPKSLLRSPETTMISTGY